MNKLNNSFGDLGGEMLDFFRKKKLHPFECYSLLVSILFFLTHEFRDEIYVNEKKELTEESAKVIEMIEKNMKNLFKDLKGIEFDSI